MKGGKPRSYTGWRDGDILARIWLHDYYRPLSCSPLAGFVVDSTKESTEGWVSAKPVRSHCAKWERKKASVKSEGSHRHLFSLTPAKPKLTSLFCQWKTWKRRSLGENHSPHCAYAEWMFNNPILNFASWNRAYVYSPSPSKLQLFL